MQSLRSGSRDLPEGLILYVVRGAQLPNAGTPKTPITQGLFFRQRRLTMIETDLHQRLGITIVVFRRSTLIVAASFDGGAILSTNVRLTLEALNVLKKYADSPQSSVPNLSIATWYQ